MKIMLIGSTGLLGKSIISKFRKKNIEIVGIARKLSDINIDITSDILIEECFNEIKPDVVINSAAIVNLSYCEKNKLAAYLINARSVSKIAELCAEYKSYFIQISTDHYYVSDTMKKHKETDAITLVNEYARTKYLGECFASLYDNSLVVRTNIVGFKGNIEAPTFLEWVVNSMHTKKNMILFDDFYTSSIHVKQLVDIMLDLIKIRPTGLINIASSEVKNKKEFILDFAKKIQANDLNFEIGSVKNLTEINRAESLGLDVKKVENILGYSMPCFEKVIDSIVKEYKEIYL